MAIGALLDVTQQVGLEDAFSAGDLVSVSRAVLYGTARIATPEGENPWY
jgi:hypothetical protein